MRRTIEISPMESVIRTEETWTQYLRSEAAGKNINLPRTSLAIFNALNITFPDELASRKEEALQIISAVSPILISANETADIGISARLKLQEKTACFTDEQIRGLKKLENETFNWLGQTISTFKAAYGPGSRESETVGVLLKDFLILSQERRTFSVEDFREYVELDSLIYVLGCISLGVPGILERCGFDFRHKCEDIDKVREKYSPFLVGKKEKETILIPGYDDTSVLTFAQIMSLQGAEMVLKIKDDKVGRKIDSLLGVPNLCEYAESQAKDGKSPENILERLKAEYLFLAQTGGLPYFTVRSAEVLCHLTSVGKAQLARLDFSNFIGKEISLANNTTTFRHKLEAKGILESLFSGV